MNHTVLRTCFASLRARAAGFTLIEVMVTVAIVGILAAIALPMYFSYIQRARIIEATTALGDLRSQMEKYYMDNRTYVGAGGVCGIYTYLPAPDPITAFNGASKNFTITCPDPAGTALAPTTYSITAVGKGPMTGFTYAVDNLNKKVTRSVPAPWIASAICWSTRPDGTCD